MSKYTELFKDPRWQKKRLEILSRDEFTCVICGDKENTLHVHHRRYINGRKPWEYDNNLLVTLCHSCHEIETEMRTECEESLLEQLKEKFFSDDLRQLAAGINGLSLIHDSGVIACAISNAIKNKKSLRNIIDEYFKYLKDKKVKNE